MTLGKGQLLDSSVVKASVYRDKIYSRTLLNGQPTDNNAYFIWTTRDYYYCLILLGTNANQTVSSRTLRREEVDDVNLYKFVACRAKDKHKSKVNVVAMRYLRNVCGKTRTDRVSDEWVLKECSLRGCEITPMLYHQDTSLILWFNDSSHIHHRLCLIREGKNDPEHDLDGRVAPNSISMFRSSQIWPGVLQRDAEEQPFLCLIILYSYHEDSRSVIDTLQLPRGLSECYRYYTVMMRTLGVLLRWRSWWLKSEATTIQVNVLYPFSILCTSSFSRQLPDNMSSTTVILEFNNYQVGTIPRGYFQQFTDNPLIISLYNCGIESLPDDMLQLSMEILELHLIQNKLTTIPEHFFDNNCILKSIHLQYNLIEDLPREIFYNLVKLTTLDLSHNKLTYVHEQLHLDNNQLQDPNYDIFTNSSKLTILHLHNNKLSHLPADLFKDTNQLADISLNDNKLVTLEYCVFRNLRQLPLPHNASGYDMEINTPANDMELNTSGYDMEINIPGNDMELNTSGYDMEINIPGNDMELNTPGNDIKLALMHLNTDRRLYVLVHTMMLNVNQYKHSHLDSTQAPPSYTLSTQISLISQENISRTWASYITYPSRTTI
uniref:Uncharacterized protein n=1 Tax=Timema monikensis TaxID=170555 RepID=A0A7R9EG71_9NEOP|nr:unnamed protein product [Timema monikensis]